MRNDPATKMFDAPCYQCENRQYGCHAICQRFADYRAKINATMPERRRLKELNDYEIAAARRKASNK